MGDAFLFLLLSPPLLASSSGESETPGPDCVGAKRLAVSSTGRTAPRGRVWGGGSETKAAYWRARGAREECAPESWLRARPPCPRWAAPAGVQAALRQAPPALGGIPSVQPSMKSDQVGRQVKELWSLLYTRGQRVLLSDPSRRPAPCAAWRGAQETRSAKRDWGLANGRKADLLVLLPQVSNASKWGRCDSFWLYVLCFHKVKHISRLRFSFHLLSGFVYLRMYDLIEFLIYIVHLKCSH